MVEIAQRAGRQHQEHVDTDEHDVIHHHWHVQRTSKPDGDQLIHRRIVLRPVTRHPETRHNRQRCRNKDSEEVRQLLQTVVIRPTILSRPIQRHILQTSTQRVREHIPTSWNNAHPLTRREQQNDEHRTVDDPQQIQNQVDPQRQGDLLATLFRCPITLWPAGSIDLNARFDDQHHEEHVEEVLPTQPRWNSFWRTFGVVIFTRILLDEVLQPLRGKRPFGKDHRDCSHDNCSENQDTKSHCPLLTCNWLRQPNSQRQFLLRISSFICARSFLCILEYWLCVSSSLGRGSWCCRNSWCWNAGSCGNAWGSRCAWCSWDW